MALSESAAMAGQRSQHDAARLNNRHENGIGISTDINRYWPPWLRHVRRHGTTAAPLPRRGAGGWGH